jgi:hypothetical protein
MRYRRKWRNGCWSVLSLLAKWGVIAQPEILVEEPPPRVVQNLLWV